MGSFRNIAEISHPQFNSAVCPFSPDIFVLTSKINGNSIILPVNGDNRAFTYKSYIRYWTSLLDNLDYAQDVVTDDTKSNPRFGRSKRYERRWIRPVYGKVEVTGITLDKESVQLDMGNSTTLTASVHPSNAFGNIVWSSSNSQIASVDAQGNVTAVSLGEATITATTNDGGFSASCKVTVVLPDTKAVDLGLSVKWADINLGAYAPEVLGDYYAWGAVDAYRRHKTHFIRGWLSIISSDMV